LGRNVTDAVETGEILIHKENMPLTQANLYKADITQLQNFAGQWKALAMEITSTPEAMRAITPPSGTPYSSVALLTQQAGSLFEIMTESKGLYLEEILRRFVIPYLKTKLNTKEEVMAVLKDSDIKKIDAMYIPNQAIRNYNQSAKEKILNGEIPEMFNKGIEEMKIKEGLAPMGNMRSFGPGDITWGKVFKNLEWDVEVGITNEPIDKQAVLQTLSTILQSIASNPNVLADPNMRLIFNKILSSTGIISPVELSSISAQPPMVPQGAGMALPGVESINK
jgi:hypothetical protein